MNAIQDTPKGRPAGADQTGEAAVQARARLALEITPKRFRLIAGAVFSVPLRLLDALRDLLRALLRMLW